MKKKDYELIASVLKQSFQLAAWCLDNEDDQKALSLLFAGSLAQENPLFNIQKFLEACEVTQ